MLVMGGNWMRLPGSYHIFDLMAKRLLKNELPCGCLHHVKVRVCVPVLPKSIDHL